MIGRGRGGGRRGMRSEENAARAGDASDGASTAHSAFGVLRMADGRKKEGAGLKQFGRNLLLKKS